MWQRKTHALVELKLLRNNPKCERATLLTTARMLTANDFVFNGRRNIACRIRYIMSSHGNSIVSSAAFLPKNSLGDGFFFGHRKVLLRNCLVICKRRKRHREKLTVFSCF